MSMTDELKKLCKKHKITAKKFGGDDCYSWAVFEQGRPVVTGLGRLEVNYYKRMLVNKREGIVD